MTSFTVEQWSAVYCVEQAAYNSPPLSTHVYLQCAQRSLNAGALTLEDGAAAIDGVTTFTNNTAQT